MAQLRTKTRNAQTACRLPIVARRLIDENRQRRISIGKIGGNFRGRIEQTTAYLRWKASCHTLSDAMCYVASELERERLYALYRELFPKEWKKSAASFRRSEHNEFHTERELEFIELVSNRYFPLCTWLDWSDFRFDHIPIETVNYDFCCDEIEWQEFRPSLQFAVQAFLWRDTDETDEGWREMLASFNVPFQVLPAINRTTPPFHFLNAERENPKVRRFLHLIEFIFHDTGNPFVDTTYCQPVELYEWTVENLEKLKADYNAVSEYFSSMASIDEAIEQNARATFRELVSLWNTGELPTGKRRCKETQNKAVGSDDAGLLINILAETGDLREETALAF